MSHGQPPVAPESSVNAWLMYRSMVGVGLLCGVLIVSVFELTKPVIARNQAEALQAAIFQVLPDARTSKTFAYSEEQGFAALEGPAAGQEAVYAGYDDSGKLVGIAVEGQGMGYQDIIRLLYGYSFADDAIVGMQVLESKETPGLGDKIQRDEGFVSNFEKLDVSLSADLTALANAIVAVKHGEKTQPWQVDGITGATISSVAVSDILNASASTWFPRIRKHLEQLEEAN